MGSNTNLFLRPIYSQEQINQYFDRINLPQHHRESLVIKEGPDIDHDTARVFLGVLQLHHLTAVPFENLSLHYSAHRSISIDSQEVFDKIVHPNTGRGGYCMENNTLFGAVLRSLGYSVTSVGGRVNEAVQPMSASRNWRGPKYDGWYAKFYSPRHNSLNQNLTTQILGTIWSTLLPSGSKSIS